MAYLPHDIESEFLANSATVFRPTGHTYKGGEPGPMGDFVNHVHFLKGMHPRVMACSHHGGHFGHGRVAQARSKVNTPKEGMAEDAVAGENADYARNMWWSKEKGGIGSGVMVNDALPINPCRLTGGQNWYDNVCSVEKV